MKFKIKFKKITTKDIKSVTKKVKADGLIKDSWNLVFKKGNIWALAVGVLVGAAFGAVVNSLANDIIMQGISKAMGVKGVESMAAGATKWDANGLPLDGFKYGKFLSVLFSFVIITIFLVAATAIGMLIWRNIRRKQEATVAVQEVAKVPSTDELILEELRKLNQNIATNKKIKKN